MKYKMSKKYNYKNKIKESELQYIMYIFIWNEIYFSTTRLRIDV